MSRLSLFEILIAVAVAAVLVAASLAGLPETLGAHPWWAQQAGIIGGVGGAVGYLALRRAGLSPASLLTFASLTLLASAVAAHLGKQVFAASFAENALAGRFWYFGWFGLSGSIGLLFAALANRLLRR